VKQQPRFWNRALFSIFPTRGCLSEYRQLALYGTVQVRSTASGSRACRRHLPDWLWGFSLLASRWRLLQICSLRSTSASARQDYITTESGVSFDIQSEASSSTYKPLPCDVLSTIMNSHASTEQNSPECIADMLFTSYLVDILIHVPFPLLFFATGLFHPSVVIGPMANYVFTTWAATERTKPARRNDIRWRTGSSTSNYGRGVRRRTPFGQSEWVGESVDVGGCLRERGWCAGREGLKTCFCGLGEGRCTLVEGEPRETTADNKICSDAECRNPYSCWVVPNAVVAAALFIQ
jgi:hypothetical protein